jgi:hypothetical protein
MWLELKLPSEIKLANEAQLECYSLSSNIPASLTCSYNAERNIITVKDGFTNLVYDNGEGLVFTIGPLKNPDSL